MSVLRFVVCCLALSALSLSAAHNVTHSGNATVAGFTDIVTRIIMSVMGTVCKSLEGIHVPDYSFSSGLTTAHMSDIYLHACTFQDITTSFAQDLVFTINGYGQSGSLSYDAHEALIHSQGTATFAGSGIKVAVSVHIGCCHHTVLPFATLNNVAVSVNHVDAHFDGSIWSWLMNWLASVMQGDLRKKVETISQEVLTTQITAALANL